MLLLGKRRDAGGDMAEERGRRGGAVVARDEELERPYGHQTEGLYNCVTLLRLFSLPKGILGTLSIFLSFLCSTTSF